MFGLTQFQSMRFGFSSLVVLLGATVTQADHQWSQTAQRERMHQQYLTPVEHQALHRGLGDSHSYRQPAYRPAVNNYVPSRSYGGNSGFGFSVSTGNGSFGYSNRGYGNSGSGNQYLSQPSYYPGRSGCGSQNSGYGNSGSSHQHGQYGGYLR
jgi:hypothetical protein